MTTFLPLTKDTVETIFGHILSNRLFCFDCSIHDLEAVPLSVANERSYKALDWGCREGEYFYLSRIEWKCLQYVVWHCHDEASSVQQAPVLFFRCGS
jgi:hypothetical protein